MSTTITARKRSEIGSDACKKLRSTGDIPGVIYGNKKDCIAVAFSLNTILPYLKNRDGSLKLKLDDHEEEVTVKEIQRDYIADTILHIDFCRVVNQ